MANLKFLASEWPTISRCLDEALSLTLAERVTWLDSLQETESVKCKLRGLLADAASAETRDFLEAPPALTLGFFEGDEPAADAEIAQAGMLIGPYRLIVELGVGGMGSVWLAERADGGLKREVALKLPRVNWSSGLAERMRRERDILASLNHPNIARIYEAGLDAQGRPYLALEYVEGEPIDAYCKQRALGIDERLDLLLQVARAVAHAHARLVVHRDLKPANILVTADGHVRLLDFGIAKLMEGELTQETKLTQVAGRALTLDYASPEQIRGDPMGTASDVYSLGVVAYELLTDGKPYQLKRQSAAALEEAIATMDVRVASVAAENPGARDALKGDLDAILNKALKKSVAERYPSVDALAQDIERHLADLPVLARPDTLGYRVRKFLRRHTLVIAAATVVSVSLVGGLSVALWQREAARAHAARADQVKDFVVSILGDADTDSGASGATTAADLLKSARQRVADEMKGQPEIAVELMTTIGTSMIGQGLYTEASALMQETVELATARFGRADALTATAQTVYGAALVKVGRSKDAIKVLIPAAESARLIGDAHALVDGLRWLSLAQMDAGTQDESVESARLAVNALLLDRRAGRPIVARDVMQAHLTHANALIYAERSGAAAAARRALDAARLSYGGVETQPILETRTLLARALVMEGSIKEGMLEVETLIPSAQALLGTGHEAVAEIAQFVGGIKLDIGDVKGAIAAYVLALAIRDTVLGDAATYGRGVSRWSLASAHAQANQPERAVALLDEALPLLAASVGGDSMVNLRPRSLRAGELALAGKLAQADAAFKPLESAPWDVLSAGAHRARLATLRSLQGRHSEAIALAVSATEMMAKSSNKRVLARANAVLGNVLLESGDAKSALVALRQADAAFAQLELGLSTRRADVRVALGRVQLQLGDIGGAIASLTSANDAWQANDSRNRHAGLAKLYLAEALWQRGDKRAALTALDDAQSVLLSSAFSVDNDALRSARLRMRS